MIVEINRIQLIEYRNKLQFTGGIGWIPSAHQVKEFKSPKLCVHLTRKLGWSSTIMVEVGIRGWYKD